MNISWLGSVRIPVGFRLLCHVWVSLLWFSHAESYPAENLAPENQPFLLPGIEVREPRIPVSTSLTRLGPDELSASGERDLAGVLRGESGVSLVVSNRGAPAGLFLRGASAGLGQLLVDGVPLFGIFTNSFNLASLPADAFDRVEIVKGASAPKYGSQALGGVVRLFTRDSRENGARLRLEGGSYGTLLETLGGSLAGEQGRLTVTASRDDLFEGVSLADARNGNPERDGFHSTQGILRFAAQPLGDLALDGTLLYLKSRLETDGVGMLADGRPGSVDDPGAFLHGESWLAQTTATLQATERWDSALQLAFTQQHSDGAFRVFGTRILNAQRSRLQLARWRNRHELGESGGLVSARLHWGGEVRREEGDGLVSLTPVRLRGARNVVAGFAEIEAVSGALGGNVGVRVDGYDDVGNHPVFYSGARWQVTDELRLRAEGGIGFRAPSFNERLSPYYGNPALRPERNAGGSLGMDWIPWGGARLAVTGFCNRYDDLILLSFDPAIGNMRSGNVANARVHGAELEGNYQAGNLSGGFSYTYSVGRNLDTDRRLPYRPEHQGRLWGQWRFSGWPVTLFGEAVYRGRLWNDEGNRLPQGEAVFVNARLSYDFSRRFGTYLRAENLSDQRTSEVLGLGRQGIAVYAGLEWKL